MDSAIKGLDEASLLRLLEFVYKKSDSGNHQTIVFFVLERCLIFLGNLDKFGNPSFDEILTKISEKVAREKKVVNMSLELGGIIDSVLA